MTENAMKKKISLIGLVLGAVLGIIAGLMAGGWLFWLGIGLALGVVIGSAETRRSRLPRSNVGAGNLNL
jgi:Mg/Co/Ni transporter MgtE